MWKVLANKYRDDFAFANHRDRDGKSSLMLGYDGETQKESKILVYSVGLAKPFLFEGTYIPAFYVLAPPCNAQSACRCTEISTDLHFLRFDT